MNLTGPNEIARCVSTIISLATLYPSARSLQVNNLTSLLFFKNMEQPNSTHLYSKNVLLFKYEDVWRESNEVYTPINTGMDKLRKSEQFKRAVEFSKRMSEADVRNKLEGVFPILRNKRSEKFWFV